MNDAVSECERVQLHLVSGDLPPKLAAHARECEECRFFRSLSRDLAGSLASVGKDCADLVAELLLSAADRGEPLLGRYRLDGQLGKGGQGQVYRAVDLETRDVVALKLVRLSATDPYRSAREVSHARRIRHPNVCRVYHTERHGGLRLIIMELVDGGTAADKLDSLSQRQALDLFDDVCEGVMAAHAEGVLHLDLKPQNVLLRDGSAVVADFGLSTEAASGGAGGGTPAFMAPEQSENGTVDARTDVFGLGKLLEAMVRPLPWRFEGIVRRATQPSSDNRFPDVASFQAAVRGRRRAHKVALGTGAATLGVAAAVIAWISIPAAPPGPRWWSATFGMDTMPADAINVALNPNGEGLPRVTASHPPWACGRHLDELLDGITQYSTWEHGYAFPPEPIGPPGRCIGLSLLGPGGHCGQLDPSAQLCDKTGEGEFVLRDQTVAELEQIPNRAELDLGQYLPDIELPCGERSLTIELAGPRAIIGVRSWHHEPVDVPQTYRVEVGDGSTWQTVHFTSENHVARDPKFFPKTTGGRSAPVTAEFAPVRGSMVRYTMDSCTTAEDVCPNWGRPHGCRPGHGWLYELEVFARP